MRRLCRLVGGMALVAMLSTGCGSTAEDRLVLRFISFDNTGITQADAVRANSADVDIEQELCLAAMGGLPTPEPFTQTIVNASFRNEQAADIRLERYTVDFGPNSGLPDALKVFNGTLSGNIQGGRCGGADRQCAVDADCATLSSGGGSATCDHTDTTISSILLVDFDRKALIIPGTYNVSITFFGSDANQSFQTSTSYVVRFDDFNNCSSSGSGAG